MPDKNILKEWEDRGILKPETINAACNFQKRLQNLEDLKNPTVLKATLKIADLLQKKLQPAEKRKITIFSKSIKDLSDATFLDEKQLRLFDPIKKMVGKYL